MSCVLLRSGLGSPTDIAVVREATGLSEFRIVGLLVRLISHETAFQLFKRH